LGAGVLCALQLTLNYWLYPYIVWFLPLALVALVASHPEHEPSAAPVYDDASQPERPPVPIHIASP
jgi:hypothetical protein